MYILSTCKFTVLVITFAKILFIHTVFCLKSISLLFISFITVSWPLAMLSIHSQVSDKCIRMLAPEMLPAMPSVHLKF